MIMGNESPQERLDRLYSEGKINREEYEQLSRSLDTDHRADERRGFGRWQAGFQRARLPWQVWVMIAFLGVTGFFQVLIFLGKDPLVALTILIIDAALIFGLWSKHRWAFIACEFFCFISIIGIFKSPGSVVINVALGIMLLTAWPHFFEGRSRSNARWEERV